VQPSGEQLRLRAERRGPICVLALNGPLGAAAAAELTERIRAERADRPARLVIDMSGVNVVDLSGARALAAAVRPVPGQSPVVVRALRPAVRRRLEMTGQDLSWLDQATAAAPPPGVDPALADSATGVLVRDWRHLYGSTAHSIAETRQTAHSVALTEDHVAATLRRIAARRPGTASSRLETLSQVAGDYATTLRDNWREEAQAAPRRTRDTDSGTVRRAIAFIEERALDDISVADIAAAAFVTIRAVQLAFRRHLDTTPLGYLRQVRLEHAHAQLLDSDPGRTTVSAVAARWHFTNASRFAAYYRAAYGVPPTQTLRQQHAEERTAGGV
jgi:anti-anti-sigma factor